MSPLLVMDDVCIVGAGLAVPPWSSSKNWNSLVPKEKEDKKVICEYGKMRYSLPLLWDPSFLDNPSNPSDPYEEAREQRGQRETDTDHNNTKNVRTLVSVNSR